MTEPAPRSGTRWTRLIGTPSHQVAAAALVLAAAILGLFVHTQWQDYRRALERAERDTGNVAFLLAEHAARTFDGIEVSLQAVERLRQDVARGIYRSGASIHIHLKTLESGSPVLREIGWFDRHGERVASSAELEPPRTSIAAQTLFQGPRRAEDDELYVSAPRIEGDGIWQIGVGRRMTELDGRFAGVAVGMVDPQEFTQVYRALDLGPGVSATLLRSDGIVLAHAPDGTGLLGRELPGDAPLLRAFRAHPARGTYAAEDPFDGTPQIASYAAVSGFGDRLLVAVAMPRRQALAGFWQGFVPQAAATGTVIAMLCAGTVLLVAGLRRRERLQRELAAATEAAEVARLEAERASEAKSAFLANVSHELRTPLTLILAPLEQLLAQPEPPADWQRHLARMRRNATLLLNRVNDTLDFSKAEAGKVEPRWEKVDLTELLPALCDDAHAASQAAGIELDCHADPALDAVPLDRRLFEKILLNLLGNALKFTPAGGRVRVEARVVDADSFELAVSDTGPGIPEDKQPLLFQRFQQIDSSPTRPYGGTGIGLALVKSFAELMGGRVSVESRVGAGSRFAVRLPLQAAAPQAAGGAGARPAEVQPAQMQPAEPPAGQVRSAAAPQPSLADLLPAGPPAPASAPAPAATAEARLLVVEDNADMRAYLTELLAAEGMVTAAADGEEAWEILQRQPVDAVVSDVMMPRLDGLGLVARLRASPALAHVPVILLTARGGSDASASGLDRGADDYVAKPFTPQELCARVRAALRMARIQAELRRRSREAGMSAVAVGILHNLGNVLNGVTIATSLIEDNLRRSSLPKLARAAELLAAHEADLPDFLAGDERGRLLPAYLGQLCERLQDEQAMLQDEVASLRERIALAVGILTTQQGYARRVSMQELLPVDELMETALRLSQAMLEEQGIAVERDFRSSAAVFVDGHKVLQILLNLVQNACHAMRDVPAAQRRLRLATRETGGAVLLEVEDRGIGIDAGHLAQIFDQGFTTKAQGHGVGLHSSANFARELGGRLTCRSAGRGRGACFTLELRSAAPQDCAPAAPVRPAQHDEVLQA